MAGLMRENQNLHANRLGCAEFRRCLALDRRSFLKAGLLGFSGLSLPDLLRVEAHAAAAGRSGSREKAVIILWMRGGPSQHEAWDPKPEAPSEYRGEFGAMSTKVSGIQICDLLPLSAQIMDKWSIIRSLYHTDAGHSSADQICFTGYPGSPNVPAEGPGNIMPSCGAIVAKQLQQTNPRLPAYVMIPKMVPGTGAGYLGTPCEPFETIADPARDGPFRIPLFQMPNGVSLERLTERRAMLDGFDQLRREVDKSGLMQAMDSFQQQAWDILSSPKACAPIY